MSNYETLRGNIASTAGIFIGVLALSFRSWWRQPGATDVLSRDVPMLVLASGTLAILGASCVLSLKASRRQKKPTAEWRLLLCGITVTIVTFVLAACLDLSDG